MTTTNETIYRNHLLVGLSDLVAAIVNPFGLLTNLVTDGKYCTELYIQDYSLSIDEHAATIRENISGIYSVVVVKDKIVIKWKS